MFLKFFFFLVPIITCLLQLDLYFSKSQGPFGNNITLSSQKSSLHTLNIMHSVMDGVTSLTSLSNFFEIKLLGISFCHLQRIFHYRVFNYLTYRYTLRLKQMYLISGYIEFCICVTYDELSTSLSNVSGLLLISALPFCSSHNFVALLLKKQNKKNIFTLCTAIVWCRQTNSI